MTAIAEMFSLAWKHYQAGNFSQAEQLYRQILQADPSHAEAWCLQGVVCQAQGKFAEAEMSYRRTIQLWPDHFTAYFFLGMSLHDQGKPDEAEVHYRQALRLNPNHAEGHHGLGLTLMARGRLEEAAACYHRAIQLNPNFAEAHVNLGNALARQDKPHEAIRYYQEALRLKPDYAEAHMNLGNVLQSQGQSDEAVARYEQALGLKPDYAEAYNNLGKVLADIDRLGEAENSYRQALRLRPDFALAHYNLGILLAQLGSVEEAIVCYRQALCFKPDYAEAYMNLGGIFLSQGLLEQAVASYQQALRLQPDKPEFHSNVLFCMNFDPHADPDAVFAEHRRWGQTWCDVRRAMCDVKTGSSDIAPRTSHLAHNDPERRLRIGYVSPDFRSHPVARYFEPVLAHHDPRQVEVYCYAEIQRPDAVTTRLQNYVQGWRWTCGQTDTQVAECIRNDRIDILVDLAGHTAGNRLLVFAHKPAPVQATWLGYMNTTGLSPVDYRLTDDHLDPPDQPIRDTEELVRLPGGMCCFAPPVDAPAVAPLPALQRGSLTFGSLGSLSKLNAQVFDLWSQVLKAVPTARLLMFHHTLTGAALEHIHRQFTDRGIATGRLDLRRGSFAPGYLGVYAEIDVSLDTFPCTGGVTTCESLWMGVPVLSLCGVRPAGRNSAALLARVGLGDWAVQTPAQYLAFAESLRNDLDRLARLRAGLRERMTATFCDARRFTPLLEEAYRTMWRRWCSGSRNPKS